MRHLWLLGLFCLGCVAGPVALRNPQTGEVVTCETRWTSEGTHAAREHCVNAFQSQGFRRCEEDTGMRGVPCRVSGERK